MDSTTRRLLLAFGLFLVVALSFSTLMGGMMGPGFVGSDQTGQGPFGPGMMRGHSWMWGLGMGFGGMVMLAFWGVVIIGVILLIRSVGGAQGALSHETPLNLLKRRYAAGQITREQYLEPTRVCAPSKVRVITRSTSASLTVRGVPGRGSSSNPSSRR